ncbi:MAG: L,D-transpeptidase, partial [Eubacterium sp.]|nr:L,D-transpeptidase [Eubacterium sp.]
LKADLESNQEVTREPVYVKTNDWGNPYYLKRNGTDDLAGTYIEADLTKQHLWYYKDGQLVTESDFVSGDVSEERETTTGLFYLAYMESPSMLEGQDYNTEVQYWMAFHEGEGLHDAVWRGSFGGNIYQTNGSHGCLNLPLSAARTIYENTQPGTPIIIYNE